LVTSRPPLTAPPRTQHSGAVERALAALTVVALVTVLAEATDRPDPLPGYLAAVLCAALVLVALRWLEGRGRAVAVTYVAVQLALAFAVSSLAGPGVGATLLFCLLVAQTVRMLPLPAAVVVVTVAPLTHVGMSWADGLREGLGLLAAAAFTAVVTVLLLREQRARHELAVAHARLRVHAEQAEELATIEERNRLARDIHDGLGHHLTVVQMQVQAARAVLRSDPDRADGVLAKAQAQATEALAEVRRSVAALRGPRTAPPLATALEALAEQTSAAGVPTALRVTGTARPLPDDVRDSLFRTAQEGLTNVRKHAGATRARLVLDYDAPGAVRLEVSDDGSGIPDGPPTDGFGLTGLRERAERLGGRLDAEPAPGGGTTLRMQVPA
jgi:signal transduction histidine kinase